MLCPLLRCRSAQRLPSQRPLTLLPPWWLYTFRFVSVRLSALRLASLWLRCVTDLVTEGIIQPTENYFFNEFDYSIFEFYACDREHETLELLVCSSLAFIFRVGSTCVLSLGKKRRKNRKKKNQTCTESFWKFFVNRSHWRAPGNATVGNVATFMQVMLPTLAFQSLKVIITAQTASSRLLFPVVMGKLYFWLLAFFSVLWSQDAVL